MARPSRAEQIEVLERLSQQSAAWLLGISARALRDHPEAPRNPDGTYNGRGLLAWFKGRVDTVELTEAETENALVVADCISAWFCSVDYRALTKVIDFWRQLSRKYGSPGPVTALDLLLQELDGLAESSRPSFEEQTSPEARRRAEQEEVRRQREEEARARLHIAVVCDYCKKVRRARRWIKTRPPEGFAISYGICPDCKED